MKRGQDRMRPPPDDHRLSLADGMLDRAQLELRVPRDWAAKALALTFGRHAVGSKHAALVGAAMTAYGGRKQERPAAEQAVRRLISRGQPAYARAVAAELEREQGAAAAGPARLAAFAERFGPLAERDGPRAAQVVVAFWRERGRAPSPNQVGRELGWRARDAYGICHHLIAQGWLALDHRKRLQPGHRARSATP